MKYLSRITLIVWLILVFASVVACQSAPASISQSLRRENVPAPAVASAPTLVPVVPPSPVIVTTPRDGDTEKQIARPKSEVVIAAPPPANPPANPAINVNAIQEAEKLASRPKVVGVTPVPTKAPAIAARPFNDADLYLHLPPQANQTQPLRVLLVLHGMGGQGAVFAKELVAEADKNNWLIVAPNFPYRDYMDLTKLTEDDLTLTKMLADTLDSLPKRLNLKLRQHTLVYGFSRGAQLGHRFAMLYPDHVGSVAAMSAGAYTLPQEVKNTEKGAMRLPFPFGTGDLDKLLGHPVGSSNFKRVSFWIGVGDKDNCTTDVPRAFDQYIGDNRMERAKMFEQALRAQGISTRLVIFPNVGHEITPEMRKGALQFLRERETTDGFND